MHEPSFPRRRESRASVLAEKAIDRSGDAGSNASLSPGSLDSRLRGSDGWRAGMTVGAILLLPRQPRRFSERVFSGGKSNPENHRGHPRLRGEVIRRGDPAAE